MVAVNVQHNVRISAVEKDGRRAGIRIDQRKVGGPHCKQSFRADIIRVVWQQKGARHFIRSAFRAPGYHSAELKLRVYFGEEPAAFRTAPVLKIIQGQQASIAGYPAEIVGRRAVAVDARRGQQRIDAALCGQRLRPFHKQAVKVGITAAEQGVVAAGPAVLQHRIGLG